MLPRIYAEELTGSSKELRYALNGSGSVAVGRAGFKESHDWQTAWVRHPCALLNLVDNSI